MKNEFRIIRAEQINDSLDLTELFSELNGINTVPDIKRINELIHSGKLLLYLVQNAKQTIGMLSVIPYKTAVKDILWIEDVCILSSCRGYGLGRKLMEFAMEDALKQLGHATFCLTSRPSRTAAREMYKSLGFTEYETGVFRK